MTYTADIPAYTPLNEELKVNKGVVIKVCNNKDF